MKNPVWRTMYNLEKEYFGDLMTEIENENLLTPEEEAMIAEKVNVWLSVFFLACLLLAAIVRGAVLLVFAIFAA